MIDNSSLLERTRQLLEEPLLDGENIETKVRHLLKAEYLRRFGQYHRVDLRLTRKYGMTFEELVARHVAQQSGYTWEVESDAMDWEAAISGMKTFDRKLFDRKLKELPPENEL